MDHSIHTKKMDTECMYHGNEKAIWSGAPTKMRKLSPAPEKSESIASHLQKKITRETPI
jgi:hypothetical protein